MARTVMSKPVAETAPTDCPDDDCRGHDDLSARGEGCEEGPLDPSPPIHFGVVHDCPADEENGVDEKEDEHRSFLFSADGIPAERYPRDKNLGGR